MNPFQNVDADAYDAARPYFHPLVFERLVSIFGAPFVTALDVACGTGQSTEALAAVSATTIGLDESARMLQGARRRDVIPYVRGRAERLPFRDGVFDIVSVGLGLHWFEREAFLSDASRVLRPGGWLLIYDSGFCGRMRGNPRFREWLGRYRKRFPAPRRNDEATPQELLDRLGLTIVVSDQFVHSQVFDLEELLRYVETQSNVRIALGQDRARTEAWLRDTLGPLFLTPRATFEYEGWSLVFQKAKSEKSQ